jgi:hypothetical protein
MTRPITTTIRAAADRIDALPANVPDPSVEVGASGYVALHWHKADETTARAVLAAMPCDWMPGRTHLWATVEPSVQAWIHFATVPAVAVVDAKALLAEVGAK